MPRGFIFVHHSRTISCSAVPNPNTTIRNFCVAVRRGVFVQVFKELASRSLVLDVQVSYPMTQRTNGAEAYFATVRDAPQQLFTPALFPVARYGSVTTRNVRLLDDDPAPPRHRCVGGGGGRGSPWAAAKGSLSQAISERVCGWGFRWFDSPPPPRAPGPSPPSPPPSPLPPLPSAPVSESLVGTTSAGARHTVHGALRLVAGVAALVSLLA
jgi:hypothetical protein